MRGTKYILESVFEVLIKKFVLHVLEFKKRHFCKFLGIAAAGDQRVEFVCVCVPCGVLRSFGRNEQSTLYGIKTKNTTMKFQFNVKYCIKKQATISDEIC
jgi:hypothetical protein